MMNRAAYVVILMCASRLPAQHPVVADDMMILMKQLESKRRQMTTISYIASEVTILSNKRQTAKEWSMKQDADGRRMARVTFDGQVVSAVRNEDYLAFTTYHSEQEQAFAGTQIYVQKGVPLTGEALTHKQVWLDVDILSYGFGFGSNVPDLYAQLREQLPFWRMLPAEDGTIELLGSIEKDGPAGIRFACDPNRGGLIIYAEAFRDGVLRTRVTCVPGLVDNVWLPERVERHMFSSEGTLGPRTSFHFKDIALNPSFNEKEFTLAALGFRESSVIRQMTPDGNLRTMMWHNEQLIERGLGLLLKTAEREMNSLGSLESDNSPSAGTIVDRSPTSQSIEPKIANVETTVDSGRGSWRNVVIAVSVLLAAVAVVKARRSSFQKGPE